MLLTVDIGNSYISFACFREDELLFVSETISVVNKSCDQYAVEFSQLMRLYNVEPMEIDGAVLCSVVPELTETVIQAIYKISGVKTMSVGPGVKSGLKINIENPAQLGAGTGACGGGALEKYYFD